MNLDPKPRFPFSSGLMLAAGYVATGTLGLMVAAPTGYATGIFPPAGLAIAAAYLWGWSTAPWIFLGSLILNVLLAKTSVGPATVLAAVSIASASALQAWVGRSVLNRTLGIRAGLDTARQIVGYLLPAPAVCLVSASVSVGSLVLLGLIQQDQALLAWATWVIGDTLGMVSIFPIMLALFGAPDSVWKGRRLIVVAVMSVGMAIGIFVYARFGQMESAEIVGSFHFQADRVAKNIQDHFNEQEFILTQLDGTLSLSDRKPISREAFRTLAQPALSRFPMLQAIEWVPEVSLSQRPAFEASQKQSVPEFVIRQHNDDGGLEPAPNRPTYYPVTYVEPLTGNENALGFDLASHSARKSAVRQALEFDGAVATEPVRLVQEQGSQSGILLIKGIRKGADAPGLVLTVLRVDDFIESLLPEGDMMEVSLVDTTLGKIIYGTPPSHAPLPGFTRTLRFGGRNYQLSITPSSGFVGAHRSWQSWNLLVGGIVSNSLLGAILLLVTGTTKLVRAQVEERTQQLRESDERFTLAMQAAHDGLWDWDIATQTTYLSPQWKAMLGYADHELENSFATWERLVDEEGHTRTMALIHDCVCGRTDGFGTEFRMRHKDGHWVDILSRAILVRAEDGSPMRMVGTHVDITERKAIAQQLEHTAQVMERQHVELEAAHKQALAATEAKSAFLAAMSHEIRTPLNAIIGMTDVLRETTLTPDQANYVQRCSSAADHLLDLINDILDLSKVEAGKLQLEQTPFNLRELVTTVGDILAVSAKTKRLTLDVKIQPTVSSMVTGDPMRLRQVLMNLVGNALKFTERGRVRLMVEDVDHNHLRFTVVDTGIGIAADKLRSIFETFTQGDSTTTRRFGGTGLGLAICHRLVSIMNGTFTVSSTPGVGSTFAFTIWLPAVTTAEPLASDQPPGSTSPKLWPPAGRPLHILLVDDLEDNRELITHFIKNLPYTLDMAENGIVAVEKFQHNVYDIVFMDIQMPLMDGLQATTAIREWERAHNRPPTPILALTAHALKEEREKSLAAGCSAHLTKPIKKEALLNTIAQYTRPRTVTDRAA